MVVPERVREDFLALVAIDSPTYHEGGVAAWLAERLQALGLTPHFDDAAGQTGGEVGNLICRVPASRRGPTGPRDPGAVLLAAHMDVVPPCRGVQPVVEGDIVRTRGATVLGGDDKAGCTALLHAVTDLTQEGRPHGPLEVVFTVAEEAGLEGARALECTQPGARWGLVAESGTLGHITVAAPSSAKWWARFQGRAAHGGVCPEQGISAIRAAAVALSRMPLGRLDGETTCNAGLVSGGEARNVVPPHCEVSGDARSHDETKLEDVLSRLRACVADGAAEVGATAEFEAVPAYRRYRLSPEQQPVQAALQAGEDLGLRPQTVATGGGSDANILNERGLPTAVLCCGAKAVHTREEFVDLRDVVAAARWMARTVELLGQAGSV